MRKNLERAIAISVDLKILQERHSPLFCRSF